MWGRIFVVGGHVVFVHHRYCMGALRQKVRTDLSGETGSGLAVAGDWGGGSGE